MVLKLLAAHREGGQDRLEHGFRLAVVAGLLVGLRVDETLVSRRLDGLHPSAIGDIGNAAGQPHEASESGSFHLGFSLACAAKPEMGMCISVETNSGSIG